VLAVIMKGNKAALCKVGSILFFLIRHSKDSGKYVFPFRHVLLIFPVLCGCEMCFLSLREEQRLRMFESGVLRMMFGTEVEEVMGNWR